MNTQDLRDQSEDILEKLRAVSRSSSTAHCAGNHIAKIEGSRLLMDKKDKERFKPWLSENIDKAYDFLVELAKKF